VTSGKLIKQTDHIKNMFKDKCPLCGTSGKAWKKDPEVFSCPNCSSLFSRFGLVIDPRQDDSNPDVWN